jgi:hypothetical protein
MDQEQEAEQRITDARFQRVVSGFNEFFDWHCSGFIEYR